MKPAGRGDGDRPTRHHSGFVPAARPRNNGQPSCWSGALDRDNIALLSDEVAAGEVIELKGMLPATGLSLRVALISEERRSSVVPAAILAGVYAAENTPIDAYLNAVEGSAAQRRASAKLRLLHEQATRAAAALGIEPPPPFAEDAAVREQARPRIVLPRGAYSAIIDAAAGGTGTLVIDERWMKSTSKVGDNFDEATAALLTALSLGHQIPVADPDGRNTMRSLPASLIGLARRRTTTTPRTHWLNVGTLSRRPAFAALPSE